MNNPKLKIGDTAPQFAAVDAYGHKVRLSKYKSGFVLLVFLRYSGCPLCNLTIHRLTLEYSMLSKNGCEVIAFVQSDATDIQKNVYGRHKHKPQYPIVPDASRTLYDQYAVQNSVLAAAKSIVDIPYWLKAAYGHGFHQTQIDGDFALVPATFLVGPDDQKIVRAEYGASFFDHRTFTSIYEPLIFK